jgi:hypothetical protein
MLHWHDRWFRRAGALIADVPGASAGRIIAHAAAPTLILGKALARDPANTCILKDELIRR